MTASGKGFRILPPDEDRCVWMNAGILSYQLCDHSVECEDCPLDAAMRKHYHRSPRQEGQAGRTPSPVQPGLRSDCRYSRNHCWLKRVDSGAVRVGIEPGLTATLPDLRAVVFPSLGQQLLKGRACLWVVLDGGTFVLRSPLSGIVLSTNEHLCTGPHLLQSDPFEVGWLVEVDWNALDAESGAMLDPEEAASAYAADQAAFRQLLIDALRVRSVPVGPTLPDGGQSLLTVAGMLGAERYFKILRKAFGN